jgi:hypothetical protein
MKMEMDGIKRNNVAKRKKGTRGSHFTMAALFEGGRACGASPFDWAVSVLLIKPTAAYSYSP